METKEPIKIKLSLLLSIIGIVLGIGLIFIAILLNQEQQIEQYYINGKHYIEQVLEVSIYGRK